MRILLDESLPGELKAELPGHDVRMVQETGWSGLSNGELLARAAGSFDVFVTADQNLQYQQNLSALPVAALAALAIRSNAFLRALPVLRDPSYACG